MLGALTRSAAPTTAGWSLDDLRRAVWHLRTGGVAQLRTYTRRRRLVGPRTSRRRRGGRPDFAPYPMPQRPPARPDLRVAVVLDDFSRLALAYEWQQVEVTPSGWRTALEAEPVDLLFVESAWAGNGGAWQDQLTGPSAPGTAVRELVAWCRRRGVPTVFWNKEDPTHFADFLPTARLFDHVLTTDGTCLPAYRDVLGHDRVGVLAFAAQPAIHNPVRADGTHAERDVAFAGMWFAHRHPQRREQLELLLTAALRAGDDGGPGLEIFSRQLGGDERYQFPPPFAERVVGRLDYPRMLSAYRGYKVFLNVNTVVDSPTMCARRIFELTACGTPVVSTPSPAIDAVFGRDEVAQVAAPDEAEQAIRALLRSPELRDRTAHRAARRVWRGHTYGHRVDDVLRVVGLARERPPRSVSVLVATNRPGRLDSVLDTVAAQRDCAVELVLLLHGWDGVGAARAGAAARGLEHVTVLTADPDVPLGQCLNRLVAAASGELVAKVDDDDVYGPDYLADAVAALEYSGADVVGKQAHYVQLVDRDAVLLRFAEREHRFTDFVVGPTLLTRRDVLRAHPFPALPLGEDTGFLRAAVAAGIRVYAADRFNFLQVRAAAGGHTWGATDAELLASGDLVLFGDGARHAIF